MNPPYFIHAKIDHPMRWLTDPDACLSPFHPSSTSIKYDEIPTDEQIKTDVNPSCKCPVRIISKSWEKKP